MQTADWIALASLLVSLAALTVAGYAIYRGNRNTSAGTLVPLSEAFRQAWERLLSKLHDPHARELADLMNLVETACAIHCENSLAGVSRKLNQQYLDSILVLLIEETTISREIPTLLHEPHTFFYIKKYLNAKRQVLSVTVPLAWFESY